MHAYIITGSDAAGRTSEIDSMLLNWHVSGHDSPTLMPVDNAIGIDEVRSIISELSFKPRSSPFSVLIIRLAHTLSEEAQQAILKTLEEPIGKSRILLETQEPFSLLPTILSRCHIIRLTDAKATDQSNNEMSECITTLGQLLRSSVGERTKLIDTIAATRDDALTFVNQTIPALERHLVLTGSRPVTDDTPLKLSLNQTAKYLRSLLTARAQLLGNANPKLTLDTVFFP